MLIQVLTLFPDMFAGPLQNSILKRAQEQNLVEFRLLNFRDYTTDRHHMVDDTPYGGGSGMVLKPDPIFRCLQVAKASAPSSKVVLLTPQGVQFQQALAREMAAWGDLILICGHYEGFDERIRSWVDSEVSIGDYVLTGGELAAMVVCDAVVRLLPGVLGAADATTLDSFSEPLLEYPHYTRPTVFEGLAVPEVLLSGHHAQIEAWRREQSLIRTAQRRPELLQTAHLTETEKAFLRKNFALEFE